MLEVRRGLVLVFATATFARDASQLGWARIPVSVPSPDGRFVAFVRNHPNVDPPDQSLWLQTSNGAATELARLAPDADFNAVAPGFIETDLTAGLPDTVKDNYRTQIPLGRFGTAARWLPWWSSWRRTPPRTAPAQVIHVNGGMWSS